MAQRTKQKTRKKKASARPRPGGKPAAKTAGVRGARINQLFQDALRDLEDLKNLARRRRHA
jgi:hypothetical protein